MKADLRAAAHRAWRVEPVYAASRGNWKDTLSMPIGAAGITECSMKRLAR